MQLVDVALVACFEHHAQVARINVGTFTIALVVDRNDVGTQLTYNLAQTQQRTRTVGHLYQHLGGAATLHQASVNHTAQNSHINVAATHNATHILACDVHLVKHGSGHAHSASPLGYQFVLLNQG